MARKRRAALGRFEFSYPTAVHLAHGTCFLAGVRAGCGCELIDVNGVYRADLAQHFRRQYAAVIDAVAAGAREAEVRSMLALGNDA